MNRIVTRFAPSPTGRLHIGHAASALFAWRTAIEADGDFLLRIEDIDQTRCRPAFVEAIYEDLHWLGLDWPKPVRIQSEHTEFYRAALNTLDERALLYPCFCTRKQIEQEVAQSRSAPHGPDGAHYPGTCRHMSRAQRLAWIAEGRNYALRLDMEAAMRLAGPLQWRDRRRGVQDARPDLLGDVVLARKDTPVSYHLCVTLDDALQGVTLVTRGDDLFHATHLHRLLQALLQLDVPDYHHHGLLRDANGKRFAKRDHAVTLQHLRDVEGRSPIDIRAMVASGLAEE